MEAIQTAFGELMQDSDGYVRTGTFSMSMQDFGDLDFGNVNFGDVGNPVGESDDAAKDADKDAAIEVLPSPAAWFHCLCMTAPALDRARVPCPAAEGGGGEEDGGRNAGAARPTD